MTYNFLETIAVSRITTCLALPLVLLASGVGHALINPRFTPIHLTQEADLIFAGPLQATADAMLWKLSATTIVKGKPAATGSVSLAGCHKDHLEHIRQTLKNNRDPVLIFVDSKDPEKRARMHVLGEWLNLKASEKETWEVTGLAPDMTGTFAGGTDMLLRMVQYVVRDVDADVPVRLGVQWSSYVKVGNVPGETAGIAAVEVGKIGKVCLFAASAAGDKLFRPNGEAFEDVTAAAGLDSKSRRFAWINVDGDGLADLVTWDGKTLSVRLSGKDGRFTAAERLSLPLGDCLGLAPCSTDGRPGVLVSRTETPLLLIADAKRWKQVELPAPEEGEKRRRGEREKESSKKSPFLPFSPSHLPLVGQTLACVVADLDNDGFPDVLQPGERGSRLWRGKAGGFERPVRVNIASGGGTVLAAAGDFAQNGRLDIFLAGKQKNTLWENNGKDGFREVLRFGGSISYKCPPGASAVQVMDLNHDGRQDLCLAYEQSDLLYHFNRGFRSFGEEGELRLPGTQADPNGLRLGQRAVACADFNADGSNDLAVLFTNGDLYCCFNEQVGLPGVRLRLAPGVTGPVTASCWTGESFLNCTGTLPVPGHSPAAYLSARAAGQCKIRYRLPGGPEQVKTVTVEDAPKDMVLDAVSDKK